MRRAHLVFLPLLFLIAYSGLSAAEQPAARWWAHVEYLASDRLEGRGTGTPGHRQAVEYAAEVFRRAGLKSAGTDGYFQPVEFLLRQIDEPRSSLALVREGKAEALTLGEDANFSLRVDPAKGVIEAPLVFVGYGLVIPEIGYDDFVGLDLKGKVIVAMSGFPKEVPGNLAAHYQSMGERAQAMRRAGAIGYISVGNPRQTEVPWERSTRRRLLPQMALAHPAMQEAQGLRFSAFLNPARAEKWFAGSGHTFAELVEMAEQRERLPRFSLPASVRAQVTVKRTRLSSDNVAAVLPGSDPALRDEFVVLSAHIDHLGKGLEAGEDGGDRIYNGAMDNAAGTATLLELAQRLAEEKTRLKRSVLFLLVTGEEQGLLGSRYFAAFPTVPQKKLVANLNADMFLPIIPMKSLRVLGLEESTLGEAVRRVGDEMNVRVHGDPEPLRNSFIRSDQYSFVRAGIPALALDVGYETDTAEHKVIREWLRERYHAPSDDLSQPVDLEAAALYNDVFLRVTAEVANAAERPRWLETSFFRRFAQDAPASGAQR